jgi:MoxR-like ATPase
MSTENAAGKRTYGVDVVWTDEEKQEIGKLKEANDRIVGQIRSAVVGQDQVIREVMIALFGLGHVLLMGVPGLAKTLLVSTIGRCLSLSFKRVQFTPDLMPSDITGTEVIEENKTTGQREFRFISGPIFTNMLLADEINRTPPKTQAALLEAMQERQVSVGGARHELPKPFFVLATQNPIEQEGTYPLPEAQLDRFMFRVDVSYPTEAEEIEILNMTTSTYESKIEPVLNVDQILHLQRMVRKVVISEEIKRFIVRLVRMTRAGQPEADERVNKWVSWGAGPRACQYLVIGAKANAILNGRHEVSHEDVVAVAKPVLGHRIVTNFAASAEGVDSKKIIDELVQKAG